MMLEDEVERLRAENMDLRARVTELEQHVAAALARIAELEQQRPGPPPFVKPNRPPPPQPKRPRKKRAPEQNRGRHCEVPTRSAPHALERCPDCNYSCPPRNLKYGILLPTLERLKTDFLNVKDLGYNDSSSR